MSDQSQDWQSERYQTNAGFVPVLGMPVLELLAARRGERILDLGCGDGFLTEKLVEGGCEVVGVDAGPDMIRVAREKGLDAHVMDGHALTFDAEFDAVFTNAALHWMLQPAKVVAGVRRALKPGGRFVGEFGGHGNVAACKTAMIAVLNARGIDGAAFSPWFFPTAEEYGSLLTAHGFQVISAELIQRPTPLPTDVGGWMDTFGAAFFNALPAEDRPAARKEAVDLLRHSLCDSEGKWFADYVRLRFSASLPA